MAASDGERISVVTTEFSAQAFDLETIKRAAYRLLDRASFDIRPEGSAIVCCLEFSSAVSRPEANATLRAFRDEVLDQDLRRSIADETSGTRNAILAYAFSRTGLQGGE